MRAREVRQCAFQEKHDCRVSGRKACDCLEGQGTSGSFVGPRMTLHVPARKPKLRVSKTTYNASQILSGAKCRNRNWLRKTKSARNPRSTVLNLRQRCAWRI